MNSDYISYLESMLEVYEAGHYNREQEQREEQHAIAEEFNL